MADIILVSGCQNETVSAFQYKVIFLTVAVIMLSNVWVVFWPAVVCHPRMLAISKQPHNLQGKCNSPLTSW